MSDMNSLAHPYASAVFDLAKTSNKLDNWSLHLKKLSVVSRSSEFNDLTNNPKVSQKELLNFLLEILGTTDIEVENFLNLLFRNGRLSVLAEIYNLFEKLVEDYKNIGKALIQSAYVMGDEEKQQIEQLLSKKFCRKISASIEVNPELIGGIKIMIDDIVIESSIKGSLEKMATQLMK